MKHVNRGTLSDNDEPNSPRYNGAHEENPALRFNIKLTEARFELACSTRTGLTTLYQLSYRVNWGEHRFKSIFKHTRYSRDLVNLKHLTTQCWTLYHDVFLMI